jgi:hypothetical protein
VRKAPSGLKALKARRDLQAQKALPALKVFKDPKVRRDLPALKVIRGRKGLRVNLVSLEPKVLLGHRAHKDLQAVKVLPVQPVQLGRKETLDLPVLKAFKVTQDRKVLPVPRDLKGQLVLQGLKASRAKPVLQVHKDHRATLALPAQKGHKAQPVPKVPKASRARQGQLDLPVRKAHKVLLELPVRKAFKVRQGLKAHKVSKETPVLPAQQELLVQVCQLVEHQGRSSSSGSVATTTPCGPVPLSTTLLT